jgi:hypothetical protein
MSEPNDNLTISFHCKLAGEEFFAEGSGDEVEIKFDAWYASLQDRKKAKEPAQ